MTQDNSKAGSRIPGDSDKQATPVGASAGDKSHALSDIEDVRLMAEVDERIDFLTSPDYHDPSVKPLTALDWTWLLVVGAVIPALMLAWGAAYV
jgi:hypothetical protein